MKLTESEKNRIRGLHKDFSVIQEQSFNWCCETTSTGCNCVPSSTGGPCPNHPTGTPPYYGSLNRCQQKCQSLSSGGCGTPPPTPINALDNMAFATHEPSQGSNTVSLRKAKPNRKGKRIN